MQTSNTCVVCTCTAQILHVYNSNCHSCGSACWSNWWSLSDAKRLYSTADWAYLRLWQDMICAGRRRIHELCFDTLQGESLFLQRILLTGPACALWVVSRLRKYRHVYTLFWMQRTQGLCIIVGRNTAACYQPCGMPDVHQHTLSSETWCYWLLDNSCMHLTRVVLMHIRMCASGTWSVQSWDEQQDEFDINPNVGMSSWCIWTMHDCSQTHMVRNHKLNAFILVSVL